MVSLATTMTCPQDIRVVHHRLTTASHAILYYCQSCDSDLTAEEYQSLLADLPGVRLRVERHLAGESCES